MYANTPSHKSLLLFAVTSVAWIKHVLLSSVDSDPAVHALQFLDVINMKDPTQKAHFYRNTLKEALPFIPKVQYKEFCCLLTFHQIVLLTFAGDDQRIMFIMYIQRAFVSFRSETVVPTRMAFTPTRDAHSRSPGGCFTTNPVPNPGIHDRGVRVYNSSVLQVNAHTAFVRPPQQTGALIALSISGVCFRLRNRFRQPSRSSRTCT